MCLPKDIANEIGEYKTLWVRKCNDYQEGDELYDKKYNPSMTQVMNGLNMYICKEARENLDNPNVKEKLYINSISHVFEYMLKGLGLINTDKPIPW